MSETLAPYRVAATREVLEAAVQRTHRFPRPDRVWRVEGPGAIACLQGIFTNDLERIDSKALVWGAVLTPKGMIITDLWIHRDDDNATLLVPEGGAAALAELLRKSFPPRLARTTDHSATMRTTWITGPVPGPLDGVTLLAPIGPAPFSALALGAPDASAMHAIPEGAPDVADALALLAGWPVLGREIDERTLVQEVRFDELQAVRYDKGCFVGQETVARLHFRGHPNRTLRAVIGAGPIPDDETITTRDGREVGTVATMLALGDSWLASSKLRREVEAGALVRVGARPAQVRDFPVSPHELA